MSRFRAIQQALMGINAAVFQDLCDDYLFLKIKNQSLFSKTGSQAGKQKTTKGTPDSYFRLINGKYIFVEHSTNITQGVKKLKRDIGKCLDVNVTKIPIDEISEIIVCVNFNIKPNDTDVFYNRGVVFENLDLFEKAIIDFSKVIENDLKNATAYNSRGVNYAKIGQFDKSIMDLTCAIEIDPNFADAYNNRGVTYKNLGQFDKAITDYSKAIAINPNDATTYYNRGDAYFKLGQLEKAMADHSKASSLEYR